MSAFTHLRKEAARLSASDIGIILGLLLALVVAAPWVLPASAAHHPSRARAPAAFAGAAAGRFGHQEAVAGMPLRLGAAFSGNTTDSSKAD